MVLLDIPDLHINHLNKDASAFLIIPIEDFTRQLRILANVTHRPSYHQLFLIQDGIGEFDVNSTKTDPCFIFDRPKRQQKAVDLYIKEYGSGDLLEELI